MNRAFLWHVSGAARLCGPRLTSARKNILLESGDLSGLLSGLLALPGLPCVSTEDFRRGDPVARQHLLTAILAVFDADAGSGGDTALISHSQEGCLKQNRAYFSDYVQYGRQYGKGHLFVGTLPSTPVCEAAIALRFHGAAYYIDTLGRTDLFWREAELLLADHPSVLAFHREGGILYSFFLVPGRTGLPEEISPSALFEMTGGRS